MGDHDVNTLLKKTMRHRTLMKVYAFDNDAESQAMEVVEMNENIDFVPDDSASHVWTERDSELVEQYAAQLMSMNIG